MRLAIRINPAKGHRTAVLLFLLVFSAVWTFIAIMPQER
jgi:hypothetical protein